MSSSESNEKPDRGREFAAQFQAACDAYYGRPDDYGVARFRFPQKEAEAALNAAFKVVSADPGPVHKLAQDIIGTLDQMESRFGQINPDFKNIKVTARALIDRAQAVGYGDGPVDCNTEKYFKLGALLQAIKREEPKDVDLILGELIMERHEDAELVSPYMATLKWLAHYRLSDALNICSEIWRNKRNGTPFIEEAAWLELELVPAQEDKPRLIQMRLKALKEDGPTPEIKEQATKMLDDQSTWSGRKIRQKTMANCAYENKALDEAIKKINNITNHIPESERYDRLERGLELAEEIRDEAPHRACSLVMRILDHCERYPDLAMCAEKLRDEIKDKHAMTSTDYFAWIRAKLRAMDSEDAPVRGLSKTPLHPAP